MPSFHSTKVLFLERLELSVVHSYFLQLIMNNLAASTDLSEPSMPTRIFWNGFVNISALHPQGLCMLIRVFIPVTHSLTSVDEWNP